MTDQHLNADAAFVFLRDVCTREGSDAAVQAAQDMIAAGAAWIAQEQGSGGACRVLQASKPPNGKDLNRAILDREVCQLPTQEVAVQMV